MSITFYQKGRAGLLAIGDVSCSCWLLVKSVHWRDVFVVDIYYYDGIRGSRYWPSEHRNWREWISGWYFGGSI